MTLAPAARAARAARWPLLTSPSRRASARRALRAAARRRARSAASSARMPWSRRRVAFRRLGLAVVDEQHRFGVPSARALRDKGEQPGRARDDGHADPAHARPHPLRRPRRLGASTSCRPGGSRSHRGPRRGRARPRSTIPARAGRGGPAGLRRLPARRGVGGDRPAGRHRDGASACSATCSPTSRWGCSTAGCASTRRTRHAPVQGRASPRPRVDHRDRGRHRRARTRPSC